MTTTDLQLAADVYVTPEQAAAVQDALDASLSPGTQAAYASSWKVWSAWCERTGNTPMPAQPAALAAFLTDRAAAGQVDASGRRAGVAVSTLTKDLAAIRSVHERAGLEDPTGHRGVRMVMRGLRRAVGVAPIKQAHAVSTVEVRRVVGAIDRESSLRGKRDSAILLVGYAGAFRRSELAALKVSSLSFRPDAFLVSLGRTKGDQEGSGSTVAILRGEHAETDPVTAVRAWVKAAGISGDDPLFQPIAWSDRAVLDRGMSGAAIAAVIKERARAAGFEDLGVSGHSLRAGHATQAAENGVPATKIQRTTRHTSLASLQAYVRPSERLADTTSGSLGL